MALTQNVKPGSSWIIKVKGKDTLARVTTRRRDPNNGKWRFTLVDAQGNRHTTGARGLRPAGGRQLPKAASAAKRAPRAAARPRPAVRPRTNPYDLASPAYGDEEVESLPPLELENPFPVFGSYGSQPPPQQQNPSNYPSELTQFVAERLAGMSPAASGSISAVQSEVARALTEWRHRSVPQHAPPPVRGGSYYPESRPY